MRANMLLASIPASWKDHWVKGWPRPSDATRYIDCCDLRDASTKALAIHDGRHPDILRTVLTHDGFPGLLQEVKDIAEAGFDPNAEIRFFCNSGRHRSVAVATLIGRILTEAGYQVEMAHHGLAQSEHKHDRAACRQCSQGVETIATEELMAPWHT